MDIQSFVRQVPGFTTKSHPDKIKLFGWFLHHHRGVPRFDRAAIKKCYSDIDAEVPADLGIYLKRLLERKPRELLKDGLGYRLEGETREALGRKFGGHHATVAVSNLLAGLPARVPDLLEQAFLSEAIACYKAQAYRSAVVMAWNLTFHHVCKWIAADAERLTRFNTSIQRVYPKKVQVSISKIDDLFEDLKESEVLEIAGNADLLSKTQKKILKEKLDKRNTAAHPSSAIVSEPQANDVISDLVLNVVLVLTA